MRLLPYILRDKIKVWIGILMRCAAKLFESGLADRTMYPLKSVCAQRHVRKEKMEFVLNSQENVGIGLSENESEAVKTAFLNLKADLSRTVGFIAWMRVQTAGYLSAPLGYRS